MRYTPQIQEVEKAVEQLGLSVDECSDQIRMSLAQLLSVMSGKDWANCAEEIIQCGHAFADTLSSISKDADEVRRYILDSMRTVDLMRQGTSGVSGNPPSLKKAVDSLGNEYQQQRLHEITVEKILDDLKAMEVALNVKNPQAVVASILARHPSFTRKAKGVFEVHSNGKEQEESIYA